MKAAISWTGALASALLLASNAPAQYSPVTGQYHAPVSKAPLGFAPNTYHPGYYFVSPGGQVIGPNYCLQPCFQPFQGVLPSVYELKQMRGRGHGHIEAQYPYHPFARSPRDFFMFRENMEDEQSRQTRPSLVP